MKSNRKVLMLPGDGIGPEVMRETKKVIDWFDKRKEVGFDLAEDLVGGASYDKHKTPLTDEVMDKALNADGVLFGAVGGPDYDNLPFSEKPERGLLRLRKELSLFANLRPAIVFDALADASSLKFFVCNAKKHNTTDIKKQTNAGFRRTVAVYIFFIILITGSYNFLFIM